MKTKMNAAIEAINGLVREGIIARYAIGGAVAAVIHTEAFMTADIDIFIPFDQVPGKLVELTPIYDGLRKLGFSASPDGKFRIDGWAIEFLSADPTSVESDAISEAEEIEIEKAKAWVMSSEHLIAIALKVGRAKDAERVERFLNFPESFSEDDLTPILLKHGLVEKWNAAKANFLARTSRT